MRYSIYLSTFFCISIAIPAAWACPDLTGHFFCRSNDAQTPSSQVTITQTVNAGTTVYTVQTQNDGDSKVNTQTAIADGVERAIRDDHSNAVVYEKFSCTGDVLDVEIHATGTGMDMHGSGQFSRTPSGDLQENLDASFGNYPTQHQDKLCTAVH